MVEKIQDKTEELAVVVDAERIVADALEQGYLEMALQHRRNTHVRGLDELLNEQNQQAA